MWIHGAYLCPVCRIPCSTSPLQSLCVRRTAAAHVGACGHACVYAQAAASDGNTGPSGVQEVRSLQMCAVILTRAQSRLGHADVLPMCVVVFFTRAQSRLGRTRSDSVPPHSDPLTISVWRRLRSDRKVTAHSPPELRSHCAATAQRAHNTSTATLCEMHSDYTASAQ